MYIFTFHAIYIISGVQNFVLCVLWGQMSNYTVFFVYMSSMRHDFLCCFSIYTPHYVHENYYFGGINRSPTVFLGTTPASHCFCIYVIHAPGLTIALCIYTPNLCILFIYFWASQVAYSVFVFNYLFCHPCAIIFIYLFAYIPTNCVYFHLILG